jgi:hypothetical protein
VAACSFTDCDLHAFRFGKNPNYSDEVRAARAERARGHRFLSKNATTRGDPDAKA